MAIQQAELLTRLVNELERLPFEVCVFDKYYDVIVTRPFVQARKHVAQIFNNLMKRAEDKKYEDLSNHVCQNAALLGTLVHGYEKPEIALNCGSILREVTVLQTSCHSFIDFFLHNAVHSA